MLTHFDVQEIGAASAGLNWSDPQARTARVEQIQGKNRYVVLWTAEDQHERIYGIVGGRVMREPIMTKKLAERVASFLLSN